MTFEDDTPGHFVLSAHDLSYLEDQYDVSATQLASELAPIGPASLTDGGILLSVPAPLEASDFRPEHRDRVVFQFVVGDPGLVVVTALEAGIIEVAQFNFVWSGPGSGDVFRRNGRLALLAPGWGDIGTRTDLLVQLVREAARDRRRSFRRCRYCPDPCPPEHMFSKDVCHSHASEHLGVVF